MNENKTVAKVIIGGIVAAAATVTTVGIAAFKIAKKAIVNSYVTDDEATKTAATIDGTFEDTTEENYSDEEVNTTTEPTEFGE